MATQKHQRQFASDNNAGICPEALAAMQEANSGHVASYGNDLWTERAADSFRDLFGMDCDIFFVFNGTAANSLALSSLCQSYHSIICCESAHIETDECGAPEFFSNGTKLLTVPGCGGKLDLDAVEQVVLRRADIHYPKPRVLSLSQATEMGTVYTLEETRKVVATAHRHKLNIHMDGARFANAVASLKVAPSKLVEGVDVLCFGGSKNGMAVGEAVIFFNRDMAHEFDYRCKQSGQLASKMRFLAAPWLRMLEGGAWLRYAAQANACAKLLERSVRALGVEILYPCEANSVFVKLSGEIEKKMGDLGWRFYSFIGGGCRLMCSWDTTEEDVSSFVRSLNRVLGDEPGAAP